MRATPLRCQIPLFELLLILLLNTFLSFISLLNLRLNNPSRSLDMKYTREWVSLLVVCFPIRAAKVTADLETDALAVKTHHSGDS
jgi:hypothetical protein